jgi:hypothetical protein
MRRQIKAFGIPLTEDYVKTRIPARSSMYWLANLPRSPLKRLRRRNTRALFPCSKKIVRIMEKSSGLIHHRTGKFILP